MANNEQQNAAVQSTFLLAHYATRFQNTLMESLALSLQDVAAVLDALGASQPLNRSDVLNAALTLSTYCQRQDVTEDMLDAAKGLEIMATGGTLDLDEVGQRRAMALAQIVRQAAP